MALAPTSMSYGLWTQTILHGQRPMACEMHHHIRLDAFGQNSGLYRQPTNSATGTSTPTAIPVGMRVSDSEELIIFKTMEGVP